MTTYEFVDSMGVPVWMSGFDALIDAIDILKNALQNNESPTIVDIKHNYMNRIIEPVVSAIADEFKRKFLTKTARTQGQSIMFFRDPFRLAPVSMIAEMADKFTRNEIMTPNEFRQVIGMKPSKDPKSDQLANRNIAAANGKMPM